MEETKFIECHTLIVVENVHNVFDEIEGKDAITCVGQFLDKDDAVLARLAIANACEHGDRLVILSVYPEQSISLSDVLVVMVKDVN